MNTDTRPTRRLVVDRMPGGGTVNLLGRYVAATADMNVRNWGLGANVRWYQPEHGRLPLVVSAQLGPFAGSVCLGAHR